MAMERLKAGALDESRLVGDIRFVGVSSLGLRSLWWCNTRARSDMAENGARAWMDVKWYHQQLKNSTGKKVSVELKFVSECANTPTRS